MWGCYKCLKCERYPLAKSGSIEQSPGCTNITHVAVVFVVVVDDDDDDIVVKFPQTQEYECQH
jgi:hypothetical protein